MKTLFIFFVMIVYPAFCALPQSNALNQLQNKFRTIQDFSADFKQFTDGRVGLSGKIFYKKEKLFRLELKNLLIVTDGKTSWNYNKKSNKVIISNYDENDQTVLSIDKFVFDYPAESNVLEEKDGEEVVIVLNPKNNKLNFQKAKIWTDKNNLAEKLLIVDLSGNSITVEFSNYKLNQSIPNSKFNFNSSEGTKVIDLR